MIIRREREATNSSFCNLYRPCLPDELVGQEINKTMIKNALDNSSLQHTLLFTGPPGTGKTTAARIVALGLNCESLGKSTSTPCLECASCISILNNNNMDVLEINVGKEGGKADIDSIVAKLDFAPMLARYKVLIFDEAHKLTDSARDLLLKPIEDGSPHVYYIFCTNQPDKLIKSGKKGEAPFIDRCSVLSFKPVSASLIQELLINICIFEGVNYKEDVIAYLAEESNGIPRVAITWLEQVCLEGSWSQEAVAAISGGIITDDPEVYELCQKLYRGEFKASIKDYDKIKETKDVEGVRILISLFFTGCLKNAKTEAEGLKFDKILDVINIPIYLPGKVGSSVLIHSMYKITNIVKGFKKGVH